MIEYTRKKEITVPHGLHARVEARLPRTEFESVDEYVVHVLEETLTSVEAATDDDAPQVDEEQVKNRLESLGYLDQ